LESTALLLGENPFWYFLPLSHQQHKHDCLQVLLVTVSEDTKTLKNQIYQ